MSAADAYGFLARPRPGLLAGNRCIRRFLPSLMIFGGIGLTLFIDWALAARPFFASAVEDVFWLGCALVVSIWCSAMTLRGLRPIRLSTSSCQRSIGWSSQHSMLDAHPELHATPLKNCGPKGSSYRAMSFGKSTRSAPFNVASAYWPGDFAMKQEPV